MTNTFGYIITMLVPLVIALPNLREKASMNDIVNLFH